MLFQKRKALSKKLKEPHALTDVTQKHFIAEIRRGEHNSPVLLSQRLMSLRLKYGVRKFSKNILGFNPLIRCCWAKARKGGVYITTPT